jgi:hypothetical protein
MLWTVQAVCAIVPVGVLGVLCAVAPLLPLYHHGSSPARLLVGRAVSMPVKCLCVGSLHEANNMHGNTACRQCIVHHLLGHCGQPWVLTVCACHAHEMLLLFVCKAVTAARTEVCWCWCGFASTVCNLSLTWCTDEGVCKESCCVQSGGSCQTDTISWCWVPLACLCTS